ncbi:MAG TPA: Gfo/Idh/MocA family oxidoreductase [Acidimicrobiales bacterium]|nr:Gfo/Idh/MocA family oxidoreductase [Acidimicrobiales bacterium]
MPAALPIVDRPIRVGVVGLGQIAELMLPPYLSHPDVDVVALCDRDETRLARWQPDLPAAFVTTELDALLGRGDLDVVDVLVPTPLHADIGVRVLAAGHHMQIQKPIARSVEDCDRLLAAADASGALVRVLEDYVFYPPLLKLREVLDAGDLGAPVGVHMKVVNTGRGGWDVLPTAYEWQLAQTKDGRGMLVFDHAWHQLAVAVWLFGPIRSIVGWVGETEVVPGFALDAPATIVWEHESGLRATLDITLAVDTYWKSDFYSCDERVEVTCARGSVRCNRISAAGKQEPSVEVYKDGEVRAFHTLADRGDAGFVASAQHLVDVMRGVTTDVVMDGLTSRAVLTALLAALDSSRDGVTLRRL